VQRAGVWSGGLSSACFNPHPSRRTGATEWLAGISTDRSCVSILTRPEGRVQLGSRSRRWAGRSGSFQSSPVPKDGCNRSSTQQRCCGCWQVSILTRPEGRVQRNQMIQGSLLVEVSILTRPEGRVQPGYHSRRAGKGEGFNPHPSRRTGATL